MFGRAAMSMAAPAYGQPTDIELSGQWPGEVTMADRRSHMQGDLVGGERFELPTLSV